MRTHTNTFKTEIKEFGREFNDYINTREFNPASYNNFNQDSINRMEYSVNTSLLKSVMQELKLSGKFGRLHVDDIISQYQLRLIDNNDVKFQNFIVKKIEEQKDINCYEITCYDNMIKAMVDYTTPVVNGSPITYPITVKDYLTAICSTLNITPGFDNTFTNYDKSITSEHYLDSDGHSLGYTFRDVLDDIAEVVGGFIVITDNGYLGIRYPSVATEEIGGIVIPDEYEFTRTITSGNRYVICNSNSQTANTINSEVGNTILNSTEPNDNIWIIEESGNGYTIKNKVTNEYLVGTGTYSLTLETSDTEMIWNWDSTNGRFSITTTGMFSRTYYLRYNNGWQLTVNTSNTSLYLVDLGAGPIIQTDTINEEYFQDNNVNIGKKYGPINVVTLSRNGADNLVRPSGTLPENICEIKIENNPILDQTNREEFIDGIYNRLNGLEYYLNDFQTTGVCYYEVGDLYNVSINNVTYPCLMLNDNIIRDGGLSENIYTPEPKTSVTDYKYSSTTDKLEKTSRNAYFLADKANGVAEMIVEGIGDNGVVSGASVIASINGDTSNLTLDADKISLEGYTTINGGFAVDNNGTVSINDGSIVMYDNPDTDEVPKISIHDSVDRDKVMSNLWSNQLFTFIKYNDHTEQAPHYDEAYLSVYDNTDNDLPSTYAAFGEVNNTGLINGIEIAHTRYLDTSQQEWTYTNLSLTENGARIVNLGEFSEFKEVEVDGSLTVYQNATINNDVVVGSIRTKNMIGSWFIGSLDSTTGAETTGTAGYRTGYIPVNFITNSNYYLSGCPTSTYRHFVAAYNSSKQFLGRTGGNIGGSDSLTSSSFTSGTPQGSGNIAYLRVTIYNSPPETALSSVQLEVGSSATTFSEYKGIGYVSGSNANGNYMKFDDGTLICYAEVTSSTAITEAFGGFYRSTSVTPFNNFPVTFISRPNLNVSVQAPSGFPCWSLKGYPPSTTNANDLRVYGTWSATRDITFSYHAIGRWK